MLSITVNVPVECSVLINKKKKTENYFLNLAGGSLNTANVITCTFVCLSSRWTTFATVFC